MWNDLNLNQVGEAQFELVNSIFPGNIFSFREPRPEQRIYKNMEGFIRGNQIVDRRLLLDEELACLKELRMRFWKQNRGQEGYLELDDFFERFGLIQKIAGNSQDLVHEKRVKLMVEKFRKFRSFSDPKQAIYAKTLSTIKHQKNAQKRVHPKLTEETREQTQTSSPIPKRATRHHTHPKSLAEPRSASSPVGAEFARCAVFEGVFACDRGRGSQRRAQEFEDKATGRFRGFPGGLFV